MDITNATKLALKWDEYIKRNVESWSEIKIKPTNTSDLCIGLAKGASPRSGWQPSAEDLAADDWIVVK